jgi:hypothetical protein
MKPTDKSSLANSLPIRGGLRFAYISSLIIALMMAGVSTAGILYQTDIYPEEELLETFIANDVVSLVIGVPILLVSMWLARRGKLIGLLFWPGALFYVSYNYFVYVFAMPLSWVYLFYITLFGLSLYTMIGFVTNIDGKAVQRRLAGLVPERFAGGVLVGLSTLFLLRAIFEMAGSLINQALSSDTELALLVVDFLIAPAWIIGGVLLWRRQSLGYVGGTGLLFQTSMLFIGLIVILFLQPMLTNAAFSLTDIIVVFIMGLICFIPFALFVRGVVKS